MCRITILCISCCIILSGIYVFAGATADITQAKAIVKTYIASGKDAEAAAAYQEFITDFADDISASAAAYEIAEAYRDNRKFSESIVVYKDIVSKLPASMYAVFAQRGIVISSIALGKLTDAQAELDNLANNYSADPNIAEAVFNVADAYYWFKYYSEADNVYKYVSTIYPASDFAMWAQMGLAISSIAQDKDSDAEAAKEKLLLMFNEHPKLPEALFYIAGRYEYSKKYERAKSIYYQIISQFPTSSQAGEVPFAFAKIDVLEGIESGQLEALVAIDGLIADFNDRPDLPSILSGPIAERLYDNALGMESNSGGRKHAYFQKVIELWEKVSKQSPSLTCTADGYTWAGSCYQELGQYKKAVECYQKVVDVFPEHNLASNDLFLISRCYEEMRDSGLISASKAGLKIKAIYQQLLDKYPDCQAAKVATRRLSSGLP